MENEFYKTIEVHASRNYNICVGSDILGSLPTMIKNIVGKSSMTLLTDSNVNNLYADRLITLLQEEGFRICKFVIQAGEASKNASNLIALLNFMADNHLTRSDALIALGGGVVGDLGGLAASLYLRGIEYIQIPTTLLAAVDSSVGGKTAIDVAAGKNLVGSFYQPSLVFCDTKLMDSLSEEIYRDGCAEVIKYGVILDAELYNQLKKPPFDTLPVVSRCIEIKRDVVQCDEFDNGQRALLNFGHTFGHSIEKLSAYTISHGSAVAKGMIIACKIASKMGLTDITTELTELLISYGFDLSCPYNAQEIYTAALSDKKRRGETITLVLPRSIGKCELVTIPIQEVEELLNQIEL